MEMTRLNESFINKNLNFYLLVLFLFVNSCCNEKYAAILIFKSNFKCDTVQIYKGKELVIDSIISTNYAINRALYANILSCDSFILKVKIGNMTYKEFINKEKGAIFFDIYKYNDSISVKKYDTLLKSNKYIY
jgi:hypothetical protein